MLAVYLLIALVAVVRAAKVQYEYCQEMKLKNTTLRKDVATMVYTMERRCMLCYTEINRMFNLKRQMAELGHNADIVVGIDTISPHHIGKLPSDVIVDVGDAWEQLGKRNGHIFIFDKCGKFAYEVITPWSKQNHPYTAMATLSALYDDPCGACNSTAEIIQEFHEAAAVLESELESEVPIIPFKIVIQENHQHIVNGKSVSYDVIELIPTDPSFHGHGNSGGKVSSNATETDVTERTTEIPTTPSVSTEDYNEEVDNTRQHKMPANAEEIEKLRKHYEPLMKWMSCAREIMAINKSN